MLIEMISWIKLFKCTHLRNYVCVSALVM